MALEPVSVRYDHATSRLYTANFLGDSVSVIEVRPSESSNQSLRFLLERTEWVGDEPPDLAFFKQKTPAGIRHTLLISHMALDGLDWGDALTLKVLEGKQMVPASVPLEFDLEDPAAGTETNALELAVKEPRTLLVRDGRLFVPVGKGGSQVEAESSISGSIAMT